MENEKKTEKNEVTIIGRIGSVEFKELDKRSVLNLTVATGKEKDNPDWKKVTVWNDMAKEFKETLKKGDKISVTGVEKENPKEKDGKMFKNEYIDAKQIDTYKNLAVEGVIGKIDDKKIGDKNLKEVLVIENMKVEGKDVAKLYNLALWNDKADVKLNVGDSIKLEGEAKFSKYESKAGEEKERITFNNPKTLDITPKKEQEKKVQNGISM